MLCARSLPPPHCTGRTDSSVNAPNSLAGCPGLGSRRSLEVLRGSWRVASPPAEGLADQAGAGLGQSLGAPTPLTAQNPKAHRDAGLGARRHSQIPLLIDFLRPLCTCKNRTGLAGVPEPGWEQIQGPSHPVPCALCRRQTGRRGRAANTVGYLTLTVCFSPFI